MIAEGTSPFVAGTALMGATEPTQTVTAENAHWLPPGSVVRLDKGGVLIHLHDGLWYYHFGLPEGCASWQYNPLREMLWRLPGTLCHLPWTARTQGQPRA